MSVGRQIACTAATWVGVPFHHGAWSRHGCDCTGLVLGTFHELGLTTWNPGNYGRQVAPGGLRRQLERFMEPVGTNQAEWEPGDVLLMAWSDQEVHVCVWAGDGTIIHVTEAMGKVVRHGFRGKWPSRVREAYRWRL